MANKATERHARVTSHDVARLAGVSQAVVSRAFSGSSSIRPETRAIVFQAAKELGYRPNGLARGLVSRSSDLVAIVISNIRTSPWRAGLLEALEAELRRRNRQSMLFMSDRDETADELIPQLFKYQPNGIIIASGVASSRVAEECSALGTPIVQINRPSTFSGVVEVSYDNKKGGQLAAEALVKNGHTRIAILGGHWDTYTSIARYTGFVETLRAAGLSLMDEVQCDPSYSAAFGAAVDYLSTGRRPTAIFCTSDVRAFAMINAARYRYEVRIPEDLSVIGFDDLEDAALPPYELTTVRHAAPQIAKQAVEQLLADAGQAVGRHIIEPELVQRRTVAVAPTEPGDSFQS